MGADRGILLSDRAFAGADTAATSYALSLAIRKIGSYDLILAGRQAIDGDTAQVGPQVAELLDLPQVTYIQNITLLPGDTCRLERAQENGYEIIECSLPALLTVLKGPDTPRYPSISGIVRANRQGVGIWSAEDVSANPALLGLSGSPTQVRQTYVPEQKRDCLILNNSCEANCLALIKHLKERRLIGAAQKLNTAK